MSISFVDRPIKGFCYAQVPDHTFLHLRQCSRLSRHAMYDGYKRVEVCDQHHNLLLKRNDIWKTQWRELQSKEGHPLDKYASDQVKMDELVKMRDIYDQTISPEGIHKEGFAQILEWVATQGQIKRAQETMDQPEFAEFLKGLT